MRNVSFSQCVEGGSFLRLKLYSSSFIFKTHGQQTDKYEHVQLSVFQPHTDVMFSLLTILR